MIVFWWIVAVGTLAVVLVFVGRWLGLGKSRLENVKKHFHRQREWLEAEFFSIASQSGKPRDLNWVECEFEDDVAMARQRETGRLHAMVGVSVSFEAVEGGDLEDNPNVGNLRAATAVFLHDGSRWTTEGRVIFNLGPIEAIKHFQHELEMVD